MAFAKDSTQRAMFVSFYRLCEKYWEIPDAVNDEWWDAFIQETDDFANKYSTKEDKFAVHLAGLLVTRVNDIKAHRLPRCEIGDGARELITALMDRAIKGGENEDND